MAIKAKVRQTEHLKGKATQNNQIVAQSMKFDSSGLTIGDLVNVNTTGEADGAVLIYDASAGEYKSQVEIDNENTIIVGGTY